MATKAPVEGAKRQTSWRIYPEQLSLVFDDAEPNSTADERALPDVDLLGDHPLWDERVDAPLDPDMVRAFAEDDTDPEELTGVKEGDLVVVADGRRRVLHMREANKLRVAEGKAPKSLRVRIEKADDARKVALMIQGNAGRLPETPIQVARKIQKWMELDPENHTQDLAAHKFSMSASSVRNRLKLLQLPKRVQGKVALGKIGTVAAANLLKLPTAAEQIEAAKEIEAEGPKPRGRTGGKKGAAQSPKTGGKAKPSKKLLTELCEALNKSKAKDVLLFALGELSQKEAKKRIPELGPIFKGGK